MWKKARKYKKCSIPKKGTKHIFLLLKDLREMPTSIMQKNYSHCPLKKRPVFIVKEGKHRLRNFWVLRNFPKSQHFLSATSTNPQILLWIKQNQTLKWSPKIWAQNQPIFSCAPKRPSKSSLPRKSRAYHRHRPSSSHRCHLSNQTAHRPSQRPKSPRSRSTSPPRPQPHHGTSPFTRQIPIQPTSPFPAFHIRLPMPTDDFTRKSRQCATHRSHHHLIIIGILFAIRRSHRQRLSSFNHTNTEETA